MEKFKVWSADPAPIFFDIDSLGGQVRLSMDFADLIWRSRHTTIATVLHQANSAALNIFASCLHRQLGQDAHCGIHKVTLPIGVDDISGNVIKSDEDIRHLLFLQKRADGILMRSSRNGNLDFWELRKMRSGSGSFLNASQAINFGLADQILA